MFETIIISALVGCLFSLLTDHFSYERKRVRRKEVLRISLVSFIESATEVWKESQPPIPSDWVFMADLSWWDSVDLEIADQFPKAYAHLSKYFRMCKGIRNKDFPVQKMLSKENVDKLLYLLEKGKEELQKEPSK